jgi:GT2 family glycosyltransferase
MESQTPRLSIVFVNYFCVDLIINAINSINKNIIYNEFEYIVVDNSSDITGKQKVISQFGNLVWIDMKYNAGFARANNAGIDMAKNNVILLLNTDTIAIDNSIANCYSRFVNSQYVGVGIQLLDIDHKLQISGSFFVRGGLNHLLPIPYYGEFIRWLGYNTKQKPPSIQQPTSVQDVDWISGAFMMVKREAVAKAG